MQGGVRLTAMALLMFPEFTHGQEELNFNEITELKKYARPRLW